MREPEDLKKGFVPLLRNARPIEMKSAEQYLMGCEEHKGSGFPPARE
jgi:hypothetical protein